MPSIEDNAEIKRRVDCFCRIRAVGSAYLKDLYVHGFLLFWACKMAFVKKQSANVISSLLGGLKKGLYTY